MLQWEGFAEFDVILTLKNIYLLNLSCQFLKLRYFFIFLLKHLMVLDIYDKNYMIILLSRKKNLRNYIYSVNLE